MTDWPEKSQLVSLKLASGQTVLSIFIPTTLPRPSGAILVFPDFSLGPAQQGITQYISQRFPTYGWAVQLMNSPDFDLWAQGLPDTNRWNQAEDLLLSRLQASLAELSTRGYHNMVVLAQGSSGLALIKAFARIPPPPSVRGLILLAPPSWPQQPHPIAESLPKLDLPVLIEYDHANLTDQPGCELCIRVAAQLHKDLQEYFQPDQNADFPSTAPLVANTLLSWLDLRAGTVLPATSTGVAAHPVP